MIPSYFENEILTIREQMVPLGSNGLITTLELLTYSLSILKRQLERNLFLIAALPNDGCYSKQRATSYVYLQTFCVRQIPHMRYLVRMPNETCIRMLVVLRSK